MANRLTNIVRFAGLVVGVPTAIAHNLNQDGRALVPDEVNPAVGVLTVTADATNVTVTRVAAVDPAAVDVLVKSWHTVDREFGSYQPSPGIQPSGSLAPQPFVLQPGSGGGAAVAGRYVIPEKWTRNDVPAASANIVMSQQVSQLFDDTKMIRAGSLTGLSTRLTAAITGVGSSLVVTVRINGAPTALAITHTDAVNTTGGEATAAAGAIPFVAGDLIGMVFTTNAAYAPLTLDLESWVEIDS